MPVQILFRRGMSTEWTSVNPILGQGELGLELDTSLYKIGDGVNTWNDLPYTELLGEVGVLHMEEQPTFPVAPPPGQMKFYAKLIGGRMLPRIHGPSGLSTPLQPSFFQNMITIINTGGAAVLGTIGNTVTSVGTITHPNPTEEYGFMANFRSASTAGITTGTGNLTTLWQRGVALGKANGFFYNARLAFPDIDYNESGETTGTCIFVGLTSGTMAASVGSENPAGHYAGFQRCHTNGARTDINWQFMTKDSAVQSVVDTGLEFLPEKVYDFYIFCPPAGTVIYWRIDNITDDIIIEGSTDQHLPIETVLLRGGFQLRR